MARDRGPITQSQITKLLTRIDESGFDFIKIENLYNFDGKPSYSAGQGE
jgi:isocitrate dehydrogenase